MSDGKVRMVEVPWARPGSGFTLLFEAYTMKLIESEMPVSSVAKQTKVTAPRIWRVFHHWVSKARARIDLSGVRRIGIDETSSRKGHNYITNFVDLDTRELIYIPREKEIQLAKRRARGFALIANFIDMAYFVSGKLKFDYPYDSL